MLKGLLSILIPVLLIISLLVWFVISHSAQNIPEIFVGISALLFGVVFMINGIKWIHPMCQGLTMEIELSRKLNHDTSYNGYLFSFMGGYCFILGRTNMNHQERFSPQ